MLKGVFFNEESKIRPHVIPDSIRELVLADLSKRYRYEITTERHADAFGFDAGGMRTKTEPVFDFEHESGLTAVIAGFDASIFLGALKAAPDRGGWSKVGTAYAICCLPDDFRRGLIEWLEENHEDFWQQSEVAFDLFIKNLEDQKEARECR